LKCRNERPGVGDCVGDTRRTRYTTGSGHPPLTYLATRRTMRSPTGPGDLFRAGALVSESGAIAPSQPRDGSQIWRPAIQPPVVPTVPDRAPV
jgi:hypothetical protein